MPPIGRKPGDNFTKLIESERPVCVFLTNAMMIFCGGGGGGGVHCGVGGRWHDGDDQDGGLVAALEEKRQRCCS